MTRTTRRAGIGGLVAAFVLLGLAVPAWAYFSVSSSAATATGRAATLGTPSVTTSGVTPSTVTLTVTAPATGPTPTSYRVARTSPTVNASVCTVTGASGSCTDTAPASGQTNSYAVYAKVGTSWESLTPGAASLLVPSADNSAPVTTASQSPAPNGAGWNRTDVAVTLTATDATGVAGTWYTTDGSTPTTSSTPYTAPFVVTSTATVKFFSKDTLGNTETTKSLSLQIDKTAPAAAVTSPAVGSVNGGTVTVSGTASDAGTSGLTPVVVQYQLSGAGSWSTIASPSASAGTWSTAWATPSLTDGTYLLRAVATDVAGNTTTSPTVSVTLKNTFTVTAPATATAGTSFTVALNTYQGYSGTKSISVTGLGTSPSGATPTVPTSAVFTNGSASISVTPVRSGAQQLTVTDTGQTSMTGTSANVLVNAGAAARLAWTSLTAVTVSAPCYFTCTATMGNGNGNGISSKVSVTDGSGNIVSNLGAVLSVTVESPAGAGGAIATQTITIPASGLATSSGPTQSSGIWKYTDNGNSAYTRTFTASGGTYATASVTVTK